MTCQPFSERIALSSAPGAPIQHARRLVTVGDCAGTLHFSGSCTMDALALHGARATLSPRIFDRPACTLEDENFDATLLEAEYRLPVRAGAALHLGQEWQGHKCRLGGWRCEVEFVPSAQQPDPREPYEAAGTLISAPTSPQQAALLVLSAHSSVCGVVRVDFSFAAEAQGNVANNSAECQLYANWHRVHARGDSGFQRIDWQLHNEWRIELGESICVLATWTTQRAGTPRWSLRGSFTPIQRP
jgi:hypothetical protein